jgi:type I restriction enzyme S subunit
MSVESAHIEKKKKLSPKLRFKEFSGGWELKKLSQLLEFKNGINASKEQYGSGFKFINVLDILNNDFITHDLIIGSVDVDKSVFEKYSVNYGDILFQRSSETREEVGTACVYLDSKPATFGGFVIRGKKIGEYNPMFLNKLLKTDLSRNEITSKSGGSTRYNVGQETLSSVALPFPSLPEQQKIASFLSTVDEKIRQLTCKKELLERYKKGVMQQLFSGKLRFKSGNGNTYQKWQIKEVGTFLDIKSGFGFKANEYSVRGVPLLQIENVSYGTIKWNSNTVFLPDNYLNDYKELHLKEGDIVLALNRPVTNNSLKISKLTKNDVPAILYQRVGKLCIDQNVVDPDYVYQLFIREVKNFVLKQSIGSDQPFISINALYKLKVAIPCLEEQQKIASFLSTIDSKIESVSIQIEKTQNFKKGLLQQMFV